ncbi:MAG: hypothetical protein OXR84_01015 [Magnetovibrio sp.]|nr:hypothetical protein [Magnetovibrio sp.]
MPFVHRDAEGNILAVYEEFVEGTEEVDPADPALTAFVQRNLPQVGNMVGDEWLQSDLALARVLEDLIEVLMQKKLILFTDFPEGAQRKLRERRGLRKELSYVEDLFGDTDAFDTGEGGLL